MLLLVFLGIVECILPPPNARRTMNQTHTHTHTHQMRNATEGYETSLILRNTAIHGRKWASVIHPTALVESNNVYYPDPLPPVSDDDAQEIA